MWEYTEKLQSVPNSSFDEHHLQKQLMFIYGSANNRSIFYTDSTQTKAIMNSSLLLKAWAWRSSTSSGHNLTGQLHCNIKRHFNKITRFILMPFLCHSTQIKLSKRALIFVNITIIRADKTPSPSFFPPRHVITSFAQTAAEPVAPAIKSWTQQHLIGALVKQRVLLSFGEAGTAPSSLGRESFVQRGTGVAAAAAVITANVGLLSRDAVQGLGAAPGHSGPLYPFWRRVSRALGMAASFKNISVPESNSDVPKRARSGEKWQKNRHGAEQTYHLEPRRRLQSLQIVHHEYAKCLSAIVSHWRISLPRVSAIINSLQPPSSEPFTLTKPAGGVRTICFSAKIRNQIFACFSGIFFSPPPFSSADVSKQQGSRFSWRMMSLDFWKAAGVWYENNLCMFWNFVSP